MPSRYASVTTRQKLERPVAEMEQIKADPYLYRGIPEKEKFEADYRKRKKQLDDITPPDTTDSEKTKIRKRTELLQEALVRGKQRIVDPMPSNDEMMRTRADSVDRHRGWENFWKKHTLDDKGGIVRVDPQNGGRGAIYEWKDLKRVLAKGFEDEALNAANLETIRPSGTPVLADTRLPVSYALSSEAKVHYDTAFPDHVPTDVEQKVTQAEVEKLEELADQVNGQPIVKPDETLTVKRRKKRNVSIAVRDAARQRMKAYWAAKKAQKE
uniref:Uncharacterized protein n=1 Tax=viral metagenome TaxID=1070528 RepID=A0A6M3JVE7_9ZZZZ